MGGRRRTICRIESRRARYQLLSRPPRHPRSRKPYTRVECVLLLIFQRSRPRPVRRHKYWPSNWSYRERDNGGQSCDVTFRFCCCSSCSAIRLWFQRLLGPATSYPWQWWKQSLRCLDCWSADVWLVCPVAVYVRGHKRCYTGPPNSFEPVENPSGDHRSAVSRVLSNISNLRSQTRIKCLSHTFCPYGT